jgi:hypothetical protein
MNFTFGFISLSPSLVPWGVRLNSAHVVPEVTVHERATWKVLNVNHHMQRHVPHRAALLCFLSDTTIRKGERIKELVNFHAIQ